jgi:hypothetical protein
MRSTKLFKRASSALLLLGVFFIILVLVDVGAQIYALFNLSNPLAMIIANGLSQGITPVLLLFIGAMIAMITGYFTSIATMEIEIAKERDNLILGFFYEINDLKKKTENIPVDTFLNCMNYVTLHNVTIYNENGLYYVLKKELLILDKPTIEKLLDLYSKVTLVDGLLKDTFIRNNYTQQSHLTPDVVNIHLYLNEIKTKSTDLITILNEEIEKMND